MENRIFALDIGTRTVTGILMEKQVGNAYAITGYYTEEHKERAMLDGQIHDVMQVADVIRHVKEKLEEGQERLYKVYVAAAGRSLKTKKAAASIPLTKALAEKEMVRHLELSAVYNAQLALVEEDQSEKLADYYCVGYSITRYRLDGEIIGSLIDQSGNEAEAEVIATFLPKIVVESLLAALERAGLQMEALTLEPIAALRVLIPESMRRLNVALVDIGAGTSDIALTEDGTVSAYGMVPFAGDEITEKVSDAYLLDYPLAEEMKRNMTRDGEATVHDILGFELTVSRDEFLKTIHPAAEQLAASIAAEILQLNGQAPKAVMLIGGGSLTPGLDSMLADKLGLPHNRVAVRGVDAIQHISNVGILPNGPDYVTPIGIAIAAEEKPVHYLTVEVNGRAVRMFEMNEVTAGDCLVQAGIELGKYYGKPGLGKMIVVNGKERMLPGSFGSVPKIYANGQEISAGTPVHNGDKLEVKKGADGHQAETVLGDLGLPSHDLELIYEGSPISLKPAITVNGENAALDQILHDGDVIKASCIRTAEDFLNHYLQAGAPESAAAVYVNGKKHLLQSGDGLSLYVNGEAAGPHTVLQHGDRLDAQKQRSSGELNVRSLYEKLELDPWQAAQIFFSGKPVELKEKRYTLTKDDVELQLDDLLADGDKLALKERGLHSFIFQDVFRHVDLDLSSANGSFELQVNGEKAGFDTPIVAGDQLDIVWKNSIHQLYS